MKTRYVDELVCYGRGGTFRIGDKWPVPGLPSPVFPGPKRTNSVRDVLQGPYW